MKRLRIANGMFNMMRTGIFKITALVVLFLICPSAFGHDPLEGTAEVRLRTNSVDLAITLAGRTAASLCESNGIDQWRFDPEQFEQDAQAYKISGGNLYEISIAEQKLTAFQTNVFLNAEKNDVEYRLRYPRPAEGLKLEAVYLKRLPQEGYGAMLTVLDMVGNVVVGQKLLVGDDIVFEMPGPLPPVSNSAKKEEEPSKPVPMPSFKDFLKLGVEHILTGYDHLLFLCGLLVVCRRVRSIVFVVTCFTLAHSLTLALAALNIASISSRIVEPAIAATIVFVGIENLACADEPKFRWALAFVFGLIHGFGFASALREAGLGAHGTPLLMPLFSFNLGVEIGQLTVAAIFLPMLWKLRTWKIFDRYGTASISVVVSAIGAYWLVQRLFFS